MRSRALVVVVLLLSYGAVGARQPAVRMAVPLPAPAEALAEALGINSIDRSHFVLDIIRTMFTVGFADGDPRVRTRLRDAMTQAKPQPGDVVPLPLDSSIWRETILQRPVADDQII